MQRPDLDELEAALDDLVARTDSVGYSTGDESKQEAMEALLAVVELANEAMRTVREDGDRKRLRRVLARLLTPARKVAAAFEADGVSVTVGFPLTVEVTFDFKPTT